MVEGEELDAGVEGLGGEFGFAEAACNDMSMVMCLRVLEEVYQV